jgi:hypothetical protein
MLKLFFAFITLIHGLIHLLGFIKAFELKDIAQLTEPISKPLGLLWLSSFILFLVTIIVFYLNKDWWWLLALVSIIISQILIFFSWHSAKFGSIANILILFGLMIGYGIWDFNQTNKLVIESIFKENFSEKKLVEAKDLEKLPPLVKNWLEQSNIVGKDKILKVTLQQSGEMITSPEAKKWMSVEAEQVFNVEKPAFVWLAKVKMIPEIYLFGRDQYENGKGKMLIKLLSLIPIVNAKGEEIDQGTMLRFLGEMVWFPSAALNDYLTWEQVSAEKVKVTMKYKDKEVTGFFNFDKKGALLSFEAKRYFSRKEGATLEDWLVTIEQNSYKEFKGINVPTKSSVTWKLKEGAFTWYKLEIKNILYN